MILMGWLAMKIERLTWRWWLAMRVAAVALLPASASAPPASNRIEQERAAPGPAVQRATTAWAAAPRPAPLSMTLAEDWAAAPRPARAWAVSSSSEMAQTKGSSVSKESSPAMKRWSKAMILARNPLVFSSSKMSTSLMAASGVRTRKWSPDVVAGEGMVMRLWSMLSSSCWGSQAQQASKGKSKAHASLISSTCKVTLLDVVRVVRERKSAKSTA